MSDPAQDVPRRVIKLGGSLLELPDLADRFRKWRTSQTPAFDLVIVGGGQLVRSLRDIQPACGLDDESMHWLAIDVMSQNAAMVAGLLFGACLVSDLESVRRERLIVFDVAHFMRSDHGERALPRSWDVTSDSIAARIATATRAEELVLFKSTLPDPDSTPVELSACGYVDREFATASAEIESIRFVDLRSDSKNELIMRSPQARVSA